MRKLFIPLCRVVAVIGILASFVLHLVISTLEANVGETLTWIVVSPVLPVFGAALWYATPVYRKGVHRVTLRKYNIPIRWVMREWRFIQNLIKGTSPWILTLGAIGLIGAFILPGEGTAELTDGITVDEMRITANVSLVFYSISAPLLHLQHIYGRVR
jgi:hypothetical protein